MIGVGEINIIIFTFSFRESIRDSAKIVDVIVIEGVTGDSVSVGSVLCFIGGIWVRIIKLV